MSTSGAECLLIIFGSPTLYFNAAEFTLKHYMLTSTDSKVSAVIKYLSF